MAAQGPDRAGTATVHRLQPGLHRATSRGGIPDVAALLAAAGVTVTTMGGAADDPAFFEVAGAAGIAAAVHCYGAGTVQS
jgi:hypothetical protein